MGKHEDLTVHELKVDDNARFGDDVKIKDRLTVEGRLTFGDDNRIATATASPAIIGNNVTVAESATLNRSAGTILLPVLTTNTTTMDATTPAVVTLTVSNDKCVSTSIVLVTLALSTTSPTLTFVEVVRVTPLDGSFTVTYNIYNLTTGAICQVATDKLNFLVC